MPAAIILPLRFLSLRCNTNIGNSIMRHSRRIFKEDDDWKEKMDELEALPDDERAERYRDEVRAIEKKILKLTGDPLKLFSKPWEKDEKKVSKVEFLLMDRDYILSKMFEKHCSEAEVKRMESVNAHLLELTQDMFARTRKLYRNLLDIPMDSKDDDLTVEGSLRYWGDTAQDILHLEDDEFYGSDFTRMIIINAWLQKYAKGDLEIIGCNPYWNPNCGHTSSMSDEELGLQNDLDDGESWAESWLHHPKLSHICFCYATHAVVTHQYYPIPDLLRMNTFEVKVNATIQQISEQDGSRLWWWRKCGERGFIDKFLHEAKYRPSGEGLGDFVWKRGIEYFDIDDDDLIGNGNPSRIIETLPDCRKNDSLTEDFLKTLYNVIVHQEKVASIDKSPE